MCKRHYDRWRRHGDPNVCFKPMVARGTPMQWLRDHVTHDSDECLIWPFARFPDGRAHMKSGKPTRVMCSLAHGPAPTHQHEAAHSCGRGHDACVNPRHLRWATKAENAADKEKHGTVIRGERHHVSKLTADDVRTIRSMAGSMPQRVIAEQFGVKLVCVNKVIRRETWKHVE